MRSVIHSGEPMVDVIDNRLPVLLKVVLAEKSPVERIRRILSDLWNYEDGKVKVDHDGKPGVYLKSITVTLKTEPPQRVYFGKLTHETFGQKRVPTWADFEFHPGKWCEHLFQVFLDRQHKRQTETTHKAEVQKAEQAERFSPADDEALFG